jgi:hypothetical protein
MFPLYFWWFIKWWLIFLGIAIGAYLLVFWLRNRKTS